MLNLIKSSCGMSTTDIDFQLKQNQSKSQPTTSCEYTIIFFSKYTDFHTHIIRNVLEITYVSIFKFL